MCCRHGKKQGCQKSEDLKDKPQDCPHVQPRNGEDSGSGGSTNDDVQPYSM